MKKEDADLAKPENFLERYNDDVELALQDYQTAIELEDEAKLDWQDRLNLEENKPATLNTRQTKLLKDSIATFRKRYKVRQKKRQKKKKDLDKRQAAREKAKGEVDQSFDKKENWVYKDGDNYNIRWSAMPRSENLTLCKMIFLVKNQQLNFFF